MKEKKLVQYFFLLFLSMLLLITTTFAWFAFNNGAAVNPLVNQVGEYKVDITVKIKRNNDLDYQEVTTYEEMATVFSNAIPGDKFDFLLTFKNGGTGLYIDVTFNNIVNIPYQDANINMLDVFLVSRQIGEEIKIDKLSNLVDDSNTWLVSDDIFIESNNSHEIGFSLIYDENTFDVAYQNGQILINSIIVYINRGV